MRNCINFINFNKHRVSQKFLQKKKNLKILKTLTVVDKKNVTTPFCTLHFIIFIRYSTRELLFCNIFINQFFEINLNTIFIFYESSLNSQKSNFFICLSKLIKIDAISHMLNISLKMKRI